MRGWIFVRIRMFEVIKYKITGEEKKVKLVFLLFGTFCVL